MNMGLKKGKRKKREQKSWDTMPPDDIYFSELFRVSKNQIIFGGNYFAQLPPCRCFFVWDKGPTMKNRSFAECEFAWTSFDSSARLIDVSPIDSNRFHPTQKPVKLYERVMQRAAAILRVDDMRGVRIIDTHLGSGSSRIAAHDAEASFIGFEIDKDYYKNQEERYQAHISQTSLYAIAGGGRTFSRAA